MLKTSIFSAYFPLLLSLSADKLGLRLLKFKRPAVIVQKGLSEHQPEPPRMHEQSLAVLPAVSCLYRALKLQLYETSTDSHRHPSIR